MLKSTGYRLSFVIFSDGERVPMLVDETGVPHWYATLFITTQVRNASKAPNTMQAVLSAVRCLLTWAASQGFDLESRFADRRFLTEGEIESLRAFSQSRHHSLIAGPPTVAKLGKGKERARATLQLVDARVSGATQYIRLTYMADYLEWLANRLIECPVRRPNDSALTDIKSMAHSLRLRRPQKSSRSLLSARRGLTEEAQHRLLELVRPGSPCNPFEPDVQQRNYLLVMLLYHLGLRAGELLALKVSDFDFQLNDVVVARRHGDVSDPRTNQPVVKTNDRRIPLSNALADAVSKYVMTWRRRFTNAKRHAFLLVTHQSGPFQGRPLSIKGLDKVFTTIEKAEPNMLHGLSAHALRHTANDRLSELMDANDVSAAQEEKMRSYLMGWKEGSGTAATYTRRHIEKKAREASLMLQQVRRKGAANGHE